MSTITTKPLSPTIGAEVVDLDRDALVHDPEVPTAVLDALEAHGVLLFRELGLDDEAQVAFGRRLGELVARPGYPIPEINVITQDPANPMAEYLKGNAQWHIDGALDRVPSKAGILTARVMSSTDSGTEFASTYAAYAALPDDDKEQLAALQVVHSFAAAQLLANADASDEERASWERVPTRVHPLVWTHRSGRKSLLLGATAAEVVGWSPEKGRSLLDRLLEWSTQPEFVLRHHWRRGDLVVWDNTGMLHRALPFEPTSVRLMHRTTLVGEEAVV